jgi:PAS domain S-box-containing protein
MQLRWQFIKSFLASATCWLGLAVSLILYQLAAQMVEHKSNAQFAYQTNNARLAIEARVQSYVDVLRMTRAMFHASGNVTRERFHAYVDELDLQSSFPGINNLNFAPLVHDRDKAAFESSVQNDSSVDTKGFPDFSIKPPGTRSEYHVLTYLEPMEGNRRSLGFDLASNPRGEKALALSRDSGELISSGRLIRIEGPQKIIGLAMRMPLYRQGMPLNTVAERRAAYYGSVGAGFDISKLLLGAVDKSTVPDLRLKLYDIGRNDEHEPAGASDPDRLLFDNMARSEQGTKISDAEPAKNFLIKRTLMTVGGRVWEIQFSAHKDAMLTGADAYLPWLVLIGGMLGSLLIYANYYSLLTARSRAVEIANDMTKDLRTSEADLAEAQHMAKLGSWLLDPVAGSMTWSEETYRIFGASRAKKNLRYDDFLECIDKADRQRIRDGLETSIRTGQEFNIEHRITRRNGSTAWVQTITRPSHKDHRRLLRGTIMDVTERKHNVEALRRSQDLLRELTAYQDRIKEDERKRIAREIHDELGQTLLALRIDVSMLDAHTAKTHPTINDRVRAMLHHIDATVKTVRVIINNLRPAVLDLGLSAAVEWQVGEFRRRSAIACDLFMDASDFTLSDARATTLFRILQESLTNVIRHANATHVRIELYEDGDNLVMKIADNGIGIYPGDRNKTDSFGLVGIEERVLALEGEFRIDSVPDSGAVLMILIPMDKSDRANADTMQE